MTEQLIIENYNAFADRPAYIYAIGCERLYIKFGITNGSVEKRIQELQTGNPYELVPVAVHLTEFSYELEKKIHTLWMTVNERNEWFHWNLATQFFVWNNFRKILNPSYFHKSVLTFNPSNYNAEVINHEFGDITSLFNSPYKDGVSDVNVKPLSLKKMSEMIKEIELGGL